MSENDVRERLTSIIIEQMKEDGVDISSYDLKPEKKLQELGINSVSFIKIIVTIEDEFGFMFSDDDLDVHSEKFATVDSFIDYINSMCE